MRHQHRAKKSLGQNFLVDGNYQTKIANAIFRKYQDEPIIEIGPGQGALTQHLIAKASSLILVEKDRDLAHHLNEQFKNNDKVTVIQGDFLEVNLDDHLKTNQKHFVIGNLPYNISSQILIKLFQHSNLFQSLFLMFQKEVALRCLAKHGGKDFGMLAIWVQLFAKGEKLFDLPPTVFRPRPKVMSSFVQFDLLNTDYGAHEKFLEFCRILFTQRRKKISTTLKNFNLLCDNLAHHPQMSVLDARIEDLSLDAIQNLYKLCATNT